MADTKTAEEWKQSAAALEQQRIEVFKQFDAVREQQAALQKSILGYNRIISNPNSTAEQKAEAQQQKAAAQAQIKELDNQASQLESQADSLRDQRNEALNQAKTAESAPDGTKKNTAPANPEPGPNTEPKPTSPAVPPAEPQAIEPADEFGDLEAAVEANTGLEEPPLLDEDELNAELGRAADEAKASYGAEPDPVNDELTVPPGTDTEEEGRQPGLAEPPQNVTTGTIGARNSTTPMNKIPDWRFRIQLARGADYLYKAQQAGILTPLKATDGVLFPYTPTINVSYSAGYEVSDIPHSNFKIYNYRNSSVENITVTGEFTAQDTYEANYLLAVIHFFRSATKMFYGKDSNPPRGLPPPLCYLTGHGEYNFNYHPVVITNFTLNYPNDVDYITATINDTGQGEVGATPNNLPPYVSPSVATPSPLQRLNGARLSPGGYAPRASSPKSNMASTTRVPTKISISVTALPVVTRNTYSNNFSLKDYATGKLLKGSSSKTGGIW
jgi:hypothetical protein